MGSEDKPTPAQPFNYNYLILGGMGLVAILFLVRK